MENVICGNIDIIEYDAGKIEMFDLLVEFVGREDEFRVGVFDLFGEFGDCVLRVGGGGDGTGGDHREEGDGEAD